MHPAESLRAGYTVHPKNRHELTQADQTNTCAVASEIPRGSLICEAWRIRLRPSSSLPPGVEMDQSPSGDRNPATIGGSAQDSPRSLAAAPAARTTPASAASPPGRGGWRAPPEPGRQPAADGGHPTRAHTTGRDARGRRGRLRCTARGRGNRMVGATGLPLASRSRDAVPSKLAARRERVYHLEGTVLDLATTSAQLRT